MFTGLVSIVIPAYNAQKTLGLTLQAIFNQTYLGPKEIIVVDDGSTDQTADSLKSLKDVIYIHQKNSGPATARNAGFAASKGEFVFFTDSDCVPQSDWIEKLLAGFSDPLIGVVCGSYGIANSKSLLARCIHKEIIFRHCRLMPVFPKSFGSYNFCVRRNIFEAAGGFDAGYRNASGEDNNLCYKILALGSKIYFERKSLVDHFFPTSVKKYLAEQFRHGFWRVKVYFTHPSMVKGDDYTFWKDIIEPPAVLGALFLFVFGFLGLKVGPAIYIIGLGLLVIELFFGILMTQSFKEGVFFGFVLFLRAVSRSLGFAYGILHFSLQKVFKKEQ
ncbi:MAG: glycosyltransferase family 2 protein [Candidatus Omnitrophica bacterium]|nr:glycosyltransferase family 2 protein [Candidatus Omnitrophota bacterium]